MSARYRIFSIAHLSVSYFNKTIRSIANGNPVCTMTWNEENRLMILSDADYVSRYTYDYTGNRVIKSHGPMTTIYINGVLQGVDMHDDENYTLYVSPYMTVNAERFTKYYYAGTQRIASKLGSGKFDNVYGVNGFHLTAGGKDYAERSVQMVKGVQDYYRQAGVTPGVPNQQGQHANPYISGVAYPNVPLGNYDVPSGWPGPVARRQQGQVFGPPVSFLREAPQEAKAGVGFKSDHQREDNLFYFHSDHLGSTSYLTDTAGNVSQFVWYAPYGEALVDEHTTTYENPFKFSGKELDDITGLYDHGARNRNPITAVWYGIDELFEKYPENGPYNYCGGNPVKLVDLDGRKFTDEMERIASKIEIEAQNQCDFYTKQMEEHADWQNSKNRKERRQWNKWNTYRNDLMQVKDEIQALRESDQVIYDFTARQIDPMAQNDTRSKSYWVNGSQNTVMLQVCKESETALIAHELKHLYQFHIGKLSLKADGSGGGILYDMSDEKEAHFRESAMSNHTVSINWKNYTGVPETQKNYIIDPGFGVRVGRKGERFMVNGKLNTTFYKRNTK